MIATMAKLVWGPRVRSHPSTRPAESRSSGRPPSLRARSRSLACPAMAQARGRHAFLVTLATLALAVVLYPGALLRGEAFFERDLHVDWYPRIAALLRCLHAGAWPLWDPGLGFGQPLPADPRLP